MGRTDPGTGEMNPITEENRIKMTEKKKMDWKSLALLQGIVIIYTLSGVAGKLASGHGLLSTGFILWYGAEILVLGIYAILWQQIIKKFDLSVAYANRSIALLWSMLWAVILFGEKVTVQNMIGVAVVIAGTMIVNGESRE